MRTLEMFYTLICCAGLLPVIAVADSTWSIKSEMAFYMSKIQSIVIHSGVPERAAATIINPLRLSPEFIEEVEDKVVQVIKTSHQFVIYVIARGDSGIDEIHVMIDAGHESKSEWHVVRIVIRDRKVVVSDPRKVGRRDAKSLELLLYQIKAIEFAIDVSHALGVMGAETIYVMYAQHGNIYRVASYAPGSDHSEFGMKRNAMERNAAHICRKLSTITRSD